MGLLPTGLLRAFSMLIYVVTLQEEVKECASQTSLISGAAGWCSQLSV